MEFTEPWQWEAAACCWVWPHRSRTSLRMCLSSKERFTKPQPKANTLALLPQEELTNVPSLVQGVSGPHWISILDRVPVVHLGF